jgi:Putative adhesin
MTPRLARRAGAITLIAATTAALAACGPGSARLTFNETANVKTTAIQLSGHSGDVAVTALPISETRITRVVRRSSDPGDSYRFEGTVLHLDTDCGPDCSVSYQIDAPTGVSVTGNLDSGDITLDGVATANVTVTSGDIAIKGTTGQVKALATSGTITAVDTRGPVSLEATSGDLHAMNLAGGPVDLRATSGDVDLGLAVATSVRAEATSGDIRVRVPAGRYQLHASADSGDTRVAGLVNDPSATNVLDLRASSGDVTVTTEEAGPVAAVPSAPVAPSTPVAPTTP